MIFPQNAAGVSENAKVGKLNHVLTLRVSEGFA
jgi:hypothetical protein